MQVQAKSISIRSVLILLLIGILASFLMFWITDFAIGVSPDSTIYLDAAENILTRKGIIARNEPMTHYPPGYPLLLAFSGLFQPNNILYTARILHIVLFGCNVFLIGLTIRYCTENNIAAIGYVLLGFLASTHVLTSHAMVWSDPPFITLFLSVFLLLTQYILRPKWYILASISLLTGFTILVRYIGITMVPVVIGTLLLFSTKQIKQRIIDILFFIIVSVSPLILWFIRNMLVAQTATNRKGAFQFQGIHLNLNLLFARFYDFVMPAMMPNWVKSLQFSLVILLIVFFIIFIYKKGYIRKNFYSAQIILPSIYAIFFVSYISFLIFSQLFIEVRLTWDFRILLPAFIALVFVCISLFWSITQVSDNKAIRLIFFFVVFTSIGINSMITITRISNIHTYGQGYTSYYWQNSKIIPAIVAIHNNQNIYTNGPDILHLMTKLSSEMIPRDTLSGTRIHNLKYEEQLQQMCNELNTGTALLIYLDGISREYLPLPNEIETICDSNLPIIQNFSDGTIFGISN